MASDLPRNVSRDKMMEAIYQTSGFGGEGTYTSEGMEILQTVMERNRIDVVEAMERLQRPCHELLVKCRFEGQLVPCDQLFKKSLGQYGLCCTFEIDGNRL